MATQASTTSAGSIQTRTGDVLHRRDLLLAAGTTAVVSGATVCLAIPEHLRSSPSDLERQIVSGRRISANADAQLTEVCREFLSLDDAIRLTGFHHPAGSVSEREAFRSREQMQERQHVLGDDIEHLRAASVRLLALKARCALSYSDTPENLADSPYLGDRLLGSLLRDLLALDLVSHGAAAR